MLGVVGSDDDVADDTADDADEDELSNELAAFTTTSTSSEIMKLSTNVVFYHFFAYKYHAGIIQITTFI